jgi:death-on-curing protein
VSEPRFLTVDEVLRLHRIAIADQGGDPALLDRGKLESAIAMPKQAVGVAFLHDGVAQMAAAYAFHICQNHPFADGNKRAALAAMIAFLSDNGHRLAAAGQETYDTIMRLASGKLSKQELTAWVEQNIESMRDEP